jgi:hypothetical protein
MTLGDSLGPQGKQPELHGVRGWLLFLCITLIVFVPFRMALFVWVFVRTPDIAATLPVLIGTIALDGFGTISGVLLYRERPLGVLLVKIFFGLRIVLGIPVVLQSPALGLAFMIGPVAWTIYLFRSERVRNTYGKNTARDTAEVFR